MDYIKEGNKISRRVCGGVVLYNPERYVVNNIDTYVNQINKLFVIDNSEYDFQNSFDIVIKRNENVYYIDNQKNIGIAAALNLVAKKAIEEGFEFFLTLDQDSKVSDNFVDAMLAELDKDKSIGILSPYIVHTKNPTITASVDCIELNIAITSGSIIRLSAFKETGEFLEKLFIDYVDHEYCLRMKSKGYSVKQLNSVSLYHNLGEIKPKYFLFKKIFPTNHSPLRIYYRTRNRLYVYKKYKTMFPDYVREDKKFFIKEIIKIVLYEYEKLKKMYMIILGYLDFKSNIFGKFEDIHGK